MTKVPEARQPMRLFPLLFSTTIVFLAISVFFEFVNFSSVSGFAKNEDEMVFSEAIEDAVAVTLGISFDGFILVAAVTCGGFVAVVFPADEDEMSFTVLTQQP